MVTTKDERIPGPAQHCGHAAPVGLDARRARIVKVAAVNRTPEVCIQLEIRAAPLIAHGRKDTFEMRLRVRMRAVDRVPGAPPPAAEGDSIGAERPALVVFHEPVRMLLEEVR